MSIGLLTLTEDERRDIAALGETFDIIGRLFVEGDATPESLRMAIAQLRAAGETLEVVRARWVAAIEAQEEAA